MNARRTRRLLLEELAPYLLETPAPPAPFDGRAVFGNDNPVEVEVGFGKGLFLLTTAARRPGVNFLGIEIERKYQLFTANRVAKRGLRNVRLACADARAFLRDCVPTGSVQGIHVYFPDPWWKRRHQKRRVFTEDFVAQCARALKPGGRLHVVTDVADYFTIITDLVARHTQLRLLPPLPPSEAAHDLDYLTNFERKFRKEGKAIHRAVYEKVLLSESEGVASTGENRRIGAPRGLSGDVT